MTENRRGITVLPADDHKKVKIGWRDMSEYDRIFDEEAPERTDIADEYLEAGYVGKDYKPLQNWGYEGIEVLPELIGKPWNNAALYRVHSLRPSNLTVTTGSISYVFIPWRVVVYLEEDKRTIRKITQDIEVGIKPVLEYIKNPEGGHGIVFVNDYAVGKISLSEPKEEEE